MEDVRVEQMKRIARDLMRDPRDPPGREERIAHIDADRRGQTLQLRPGHDRRRRHEKQRGGRCGERRATSSRAPRAIGSQ